jgi:hypothetical protein
LTTGASAAVTGPTVVEVVGPEASLDLDLAAAVRAGARAVRIAGSQVLSVTSPRPTLAVIRLLRDAASHGLPVIWHGQVDGTLDSTLFVHLAPPAARDVAGDTSTDEWRRRHQPGLCYYRVGPGFVFVKDVRRHGAAARYLLDDEAPEGFARLEAIVEVATLDPLTLELLDGLQEEGLAIQIEGHATLLAHRMRRWPVPAIDV